MKKALIALLACLIVLTGCTKSPAPAPSETETVPVTTEAPTEPPTETTATEPVETQAPVTGPVNPLTGLPGDASLAESRPYAVMINNIRVAQPQCGTTKADVIYEVLAEGGITRMMAIFSSLEGETPIGSIRSLRPYYLSIARAYDAVVIHAGGSPQAYADLESSGWDHIDGVNGPNSGSYYYRVQSRIDTAGYEHSLFIDADDALAYIRERDCRTQRQSQASPIVFSQDALTQGDDAQSVTVHFRTSKETSFTYDPDTGLYSGFQYGEDWADGNDGTVQTFRNILVLYAETQTIDDTGRLAIDLVGEGEGYLIRDGKCVAITWSREEEDAPFIYHLPDGTEAALGTGRTYVAVTPTGSALDLA